MIEVSQLIKELEELKFNPIDTSHSAGEWHDKGYNNAIDDMILLLLKEIKRKNRVPEHQNCEVCDRIEGQIDTSQ